MISFTLLYVNNYFLTFTNIYNYNTFHKYLDKKYLNYVIKRDFNRNCKVKITKVCNYNTILLLDKQRFFCKHCNKTFTTSTNIIDFHKQIPNILKKEKVNFHYIVT